MKRLSYLLLGMILLINSCQDQEPVIDQPSPISEAFAEYFSALTSLGKFNGVIYVSQNGVPQIHQAFNLNSDTESSLYVSKTSQFDIHSVSKLMAHYLILQLDKEGKLSFADPLSNYIPDFPRGEEISIRMLLDHSSGLPRELSQPVEKPLDLELSDIIDLIKQEPLIFEPGKGEQYSNLAYQLIYFIIGEIGEDSFEEYLTDKLFLPLGMQGSGAHFYTEQKNIKDLAANHELSGDSIKQVPNILEEEFKTARIYSTATDLMLFLEALQQDPLSFSIKKDSVIQQSGGSDGIRTHVYADLRSKTNFVLLSNYEGIPFMKTIKDMIAILEGEPYEVPKKIERKAIQLEEEILARYTGTYSFADMNQLELEIAIAEGSLGVFQDGELAGLLQAENDSTFFENPNEAESFEFIINQQGSYDLLMGWKGVKLKGIRQ